MHKVLIKENDDLLSFCRCEETTFAVSGQQDCPWCGCGFMFSCLSGRKGFIFAKVVESTTSFLEIMQRNAEVFGITASLDDADLIEEADFWRTKVEQLNVGQVCVILDETIVGIESRNISFDGSYAHHEFDVIPHVSANGSQKALLSILGKAGYWTSRELEERE
jgi:hypothetical protein